MPLFLITYFIKKCASQLVCKETCRYRQHVCVTGTGSTCVLQVPAARVCYRYRQHVCVTGTGSTCVLQVLAARVCFQDLFYNNLYQNVCSKINIDQCFLNTTQHYPHGYTPHSSGWPEPYTCGVYSAYLAGKSPNILS